MTGPWREPREASVGLYPGLEVDDGRVTGSIVIGKSRVALWAFVSWLTNGWDEIHDAYEPENYGWDEHQMGVFLYSLMECRGEFARLLLILADAERLDRGNRPWWETKRHRKRVRDQLLRCLDAVAEPEPRKDIPD